MVGGLEQALAQGESDVSEFLNSARCVVDLGAGIGMHAIPLARAGSRVLAIDSSAHLLSKLECASEGLAIRTVQADILDFPAHLSERPDLILCMGDTLTHLQSLREVDQLFEAVAVALNPGGTFLATFRDYRRLPLGDNRFIPVRSDHDRIHTCFLEERSEHVVVHDVLHERVDEGWRMQVSSYLKSRLDPAAVAGVATAVGLRCEVEQGPRGMLRLRADA
jgi:SAM-dependent methyltransferase